MPLLTMVKRPAKPTLDRRQLKRLKQPRA